MSSKIICGDIEKWIKEVPPLTIKAADMQCIDGIYNYYGGLLISQKNNKYYWGIEDYSDPVIAKEIPKYLYEALTAFQKSQASKRIDK